MQILKQLSDKRVVQIACGEEHSLVLTDKGDVYSWGRGYEGQLGISNHTKIAQTPQYVKHFFGNPVSFVECGAYYSLAIADHKIYGWGEARLGQLGLGDPKDKTNTKMGRVVMMPTLIEINHPEEERQSS